VAPSKKICTLFFRRVRLKLTDQDIGIEDATPVFLAAIQAFLQDRDLVGQWSNVAGLV
jgi:hypothetical protein